MSRCFKPLKFDCLLTREKNSKSPKIYSVIEMLQVTIEHQYDNGAVIPLRVHTIVISTQHNEEVDVKELRQEIMEKVIAADIYLLNVIYLRSAVDLEVPQNKGLVFPKIALEYNKSSSNLKHLLCRQDAPKHSANRVLWIRSKSHLHQLVT